MEKIGDILKRTTSTISQQNQNLSSLITENNLNQECQQRWDNYVGRALIKTAVWAIIKSATVVIWQNDKVIVVVAYQVHFNKLSDSITELRKLLWDFKGNEIPVELTLNKELLDLLKTPERKEEERKRAEREALREQEIEQEKQEKLKIAKINALALANASNYKFDTFKVIPSNKSAFALCKDWAENKEPGLYHHFLTLAGECGRGKTRMAKTIIHTRIMSISEQPSKNIFYQVPDLLNALRNGYEDNTFEAILYKCKNAELLVLDDLGMQKNTEWTLEQLDSLIDYRYDHLLDTVFTTNLTLDKFPERIKSRLSEGEMVVFVGDDYRQTIAKERIAKRKAK